MSYLILIRHGESLWNQKGLWTGWTDIELSDKGRAEARSAGEAIRGYPIDDVFISNLSRAKETWEEISHILDIPSPKIHQSDALNERDYGDYTGKNKWDLKKSLGDETFQKIRRGWDTPIPSGESLKDVSARVLPYFQSEILPELKNGKNVLISAHGNSLRALVKYLDHLTDDDITNLEIKTGEVYIYSLNEKGEITDKKIISKHLQ